MTFRVRIEPRPAAEGIDGTVYVLEEEGAGRALVWPAAGFNCYHWEMLAEGRHAYNLLFADPGFFNHGKPTRSGIPILFPFPNRIRNGEFTWEGKTYRVPRNDAGGENAIHGFACRRAWRVVDRGEDAGQAWVTGEFRASTEAADVRELWPAEYVLRVTYTLGSGRLRVTAEVENPDQVALPFGLGYHPYFRIPPAGMDQAADCRIEVPAREYWELQAGVPTGERRPVDASRDLNQPRPFGELLLDDVLTDLPGLAGEDGLCDRGTVRWNTGPAELRVRASADFRETVVFTPAHRQAFCIEPYTCATDAANLGQRGIEAGWRVLRPGERWRGVVEMTVHVGKAR